MGDGTDTDTGTKPQGSKRFGVREIHLPGSTTNERTNK